LPLQYDFKATQHMTERGSDTRNQPDGIQSDKELSHNSAWQSTTSHKFSLATKQHVLRSRFRPPDPSHAATHINGYQYLITLTLILLTWRIWWANNVSKWQMGFNWVFKGL